MQAFSTLQKTDYKYTPIDRLGGANSSIFTISDLAVRWNRVGVSLISQTFLFNSKDHFLCFHVLILEAIGTERVSLVVRSSLVNSLLRNSILISY